MIEPALSLAISLHSNKSIYALLLGSGISRSAGIPTGWEVVLDLSRKLALLQGEDCESDPAAWYKKTFSEEPSYSALLDALAKSPSERSQLLRSYFEPSEAEREQGLKVPTTAHKAIAELVLSGYIRVIVTTNFDRLLEQALEAVGVVPIVISTPDAVEGALPLTHTRCSIIKVHGDYLDIRIKNTPDELEHYDKRLNSLLDRIFDEFGLIICGWSAEWDTALRAALERCQGHRFTTYWAARGVLGEVAKPLVTLRRGEIIQIRDADTFFQELAEKVAALQEIDRPHPLSAKVAIATVKKYLVDDRYRIRLHDLVMEELNKLDGGLSDTHFPVGMPPTPEALIQRVQRYEALAEILLAIMITGCYWGEKSHEKLWMKCLERLAYRSNAISGMTAWINLRLYPALLLLYGGGIAAIAAGRYDTFAALLTKAAATVESKDQPLVLAVFTWGVMDEAVGRQLPNMKGHFTPLSDHLYMVLRESLKEYLPQDIRYQECFDRFEYLLGLVYVDLRYKQNGNAPEPIRVWGPVGCFMWRDGRYSNECRIMKEIELEVTKAGKDWPILAAGLFDASVERFQFIKTSYDQFVNGVT